LRRADSSQPSIKLGDYSITLLTKYGLQRYPMFISQIFIAAMPLMYLKSINEVERIVVWGAGFTILRLVTMLAGPINTIVLPKYSEMLSKSDSNITNEVWKLSILALVVGPPLMLGLHFAMNPMIEFWIGIDTTPYVVDTIILSCVMPFMFGAELLRSTVDALQTHSLNSYIYIWSIVLAASIVSAIVSISGFSPEYILNYLILVYAFIYFFSNASLHLKIKFNKPQLCYLIMGMTMNTLLILAGLSFV